MAAEPGARVSSRMVIEIGKDRRVIVDARRRCGRTGAGACHSGAAMIPVAAGVRIWIASGHTDMRKGMNGLALLVQEGLGRDPFAGDNRTSPRAARFGQDPASLRVGPAHRQEGTVVSSA
jgi:hypothetical protein